MPRKRFGIKDVTFLRDNAIGSGGVSGFKDGGGGGGGFRLSGFLFEEDEKVGFWVDLKIHLKEGVRE